MLSTYFLELLKRFFVTRLCYRIVLVDYIIHETFHWGNEMRLIENAHRKKNKIIDSSPFPSTDVDKVSSLLKKCPVASKTPLLELEKFLPQGKLWVKDEREEWDLVHLKLLVLLM